MTLELLHGPLNEGLVHLIDMLYKCLLSLCIQNCWWLLIFIANTLFICYCSTFISVLLFITLFGGLRCKRIWWVYSWPLRSWFTFLKRLWLLWLFRLCVVVFYRAIACIRVVLLILFHLSSLLLFCLHFFLLSEHLFILADLLSLTVFISTAPRFILLSCWK